MRYAFEPDATQQSLLPYLQRTEELLTRATTSLSARSQPARITAMPDLGLPHNVTRIRGGFLTGAYYQWDCDIPFIPIDVTLNLCGVALFELSQASPLIDSFHDRIPGARSAWQELGFVWNFTNGNHFLILARDSVTDVHYLCIHASPAEFKTQFAGLYPSGKNWYAGKEMVFRDGDQDGRYLRFLFGSSATRFIEQANWMRGFQTDRQRFIAELLAGPEGIANETFNESHYRMPDSQSVSIGCYLTKPGFDYMLLTRPSAPLFLIRSAGGADNTVVIDGTEYHINPHGLGVKSNEPLDISVEGEDLILWGQRHQGGQTLQDRREIQIRDFDLRETLSQTIDSCPGTVAQQLDQVHSIHHQGSH